jgi:hypothetical protein
MELLLQRQTESSEWTQGVLSIIGDSSKIFTLEDQSQAKKVMHETRIPSGRYEIELRTFGGHHEKYKIKFPDIHVGMLWLQNVPGFHDILIHIGNTDDDSSGCILVGSTFVAGKLTLSTTAYITLYKKVIAAFNKKEKVFITVKDING